MASQTEGERMSTGNRTLDDLLDQAPPQTLACAFALSCLASNCGTWNGKIWEALGARVQPLRGQCKGDPSGDPDEVFVPRWLALADGVEVGYAIQK